jgi:protease-4
MLLFITRLFAVIGLLVVLLAGLGVAALLYFAERPEAEPDAVILTLDFNQPIVERSSFSPLSIAIHEEATSLLDILRAVDKAKTDSHVKGIVAHFGATQPKLAEAQEIRATIKSFRASGKFTYAFAPTYGEFGMGNRAYFLASAFDNIWLQPVGAVGLSGLAIQEPFGKTALDKIGVKADFMQREEYKSFMDMAERDDFAPQVRANMQSLLDDLATQEAEGIADSRGFDAAHVRDLMARGPFTDEEALKEKLVTRLAYADELDDELDQKAGKDSKDVDVATYLGFASTAKGAAKAKVALIYGTGLITEKDDDAAGITGDEVMGADKIADAFDAAADDKDIKAVLFRVDSPGGSPEASETIRRALIHAQKKGKPVFVSMGDVAASGGYWIAMNADSIVANPATLTGSIGVLAGKFTGAELLQKLGVTVSTLKTSENAGMWSLAAGFTPSQRERVNAMLDNTYRAFTRNVAEARHIAPEKMPDIAKGRVWTGAQAAKIGLVDELGGFGSAMGAIRKKLGLTGDDAVALEIFPPPETPVERILKLFKTFGVEEAALRPLILQGRMIQAVVGTFATGTEAFRSPIDAANIK